MITTQVSTTRQRQGYW